MVLSSAELRLRTLGTAGLSSRQRQGATHLRLGGAQSQKDFEKVTLAVTARSAFQVWLWEVSKAFLILSL